MADEEAETGNTADDAKKTRFLEATFEEVRKSKQELELKEKELQERLDEIRGKIGITEDEERTAEEGLKDLMKIKERFDELLREEKTLRNQESFTEEDLQKVRQKLGKIKKLLEDLEE
ncbi:hypothetical protein HYU16_01855 [Candidatus Woesearchaeota archaeon]|nr:hypothetical protein [Candidatus Woesearchaeota archaeon]MBI2550172.1 hypothetical protein [Candidatus Woesearchaeota archaeon]